MIMKMHVLAATAFAAILPFAAQAATVTSGFNYDVAVLTPSTGSYSVTYEVGDSSWDISPVSFTANGVWSDIQEVTITFSNDPGTIYSLWTQGEGSTATLVADGFTTSDDFIITYLYSGAGVVLATATFTATELPAVPVPAAGVLLVSALAGLGVAAKRRRNKA
ncbi:hypothetical protein D2T29_13790 [Sinirhodobacter populi]|uniref:VPLPA-CTERM sorting domain-containing protein n=1 Tax=Paenirhodobacter populi TaxID=2306993 RepID=A0A443KAR2_9RHOB|nr:VPLPA-CTERM sorting domain-containing protein [Sinirhodobacter populi]RWR29850.1 hypothetical protein D2T29_13790 [Sinirhodobacter populi]